MDIDQLVTVTEAAEIMGRSSVHVRALIGKSGGKGPPLRAVKAGPVWMVLREDAAAFSPRPAGRPRKADPASLVNPAKPKRTEAQKPAKRARKVAGKPAPRSKATKPKRSPAKATKPRNR
jgi:hypothetical protein